MTVARSDGRPSTRIAIAAFASAGPIAPAMSLPVTGPANSRRLPSGRVTATGLGAWARPDESGACALLSGCSIIVLCAPSLSAVPTGRTGREKPRPLADGVVRVEPLPLVQRTRPPGAPPLRVLVVVATRIRQPSLMPEISRATPLHVKAGVRFAKPQIPFMRVLPRRSSSKRVIEELRRLARYHPGSGRTTIRFAR